ncbi:MAG: nucleolar RNA-binding Nop10p family protein [Candidatus Kariarchaeaceae archaeon]
MNCFHYSLIKQKCPNCGEELQNPYPARFSLEKEQKYRRLFRKIK